MLKSAFKDFNHEKHETSSALRAAEFMKGAPMKICYPDGVTHVEIGDRIKYKVMLFWKKAEVTYLPGISPPRKDMTDSGMDCVGVTTPKDWELAYLVDPEDGKVIGDIKFVSRAVK